MKHLLTAIFLMLIFSAAHPQKADIIKLPALQQLLNKQDDTTYVINFMATWCKPCMEELPFFEKLGAEMKGTKLKIIYISLDQAAHLESKLNTMLQRRKITSTTHLLDETDYNAWIDKIEPTWDGAIPVTFIINHHKNFRKFIHTSTTYEQLSSIVQQLN